MTRWALFAAVFLLLAPPASAQKLTLEIRDGRVTLDATNVPVRQILAEWAKVGGTTVVNGERIAGAPVTLTLVDVPEKQALEIVLRNVAGYMAAARADASTGASRFDRILVLATSTAPPASAAAPAAPSGRPAFAPGNPAMNGTQRIIRGPIVQAPPEQGEEYVDQDMEMPPPPEGGNIFVPTSPNPMPFGQPGQPFRFPTGGNPNSPIIMMPGQGQPPAEAPPEETTAPAGASVPGSITPPRRPPG
ncbi:MAG: hypothetical protein Q8L86_18005 [Vicinamibacterales bacterium]|nr:hypothetical protein [Vicinamibacterales bacterium]